MNRKVTVLLIAAISVLVFVVGSFVYSELNTSTEPKLSGNAKLEREYSPVIGAIDAPVTVVEFFDPACEACRAFHPYVKRLITESRGNVRVVLRYAAFHQPSEEAVRILEAARKQGLFDVVLERLYETQPRWAPHGKPAEEIWPMLVGTGLDIDLAKQDALHNDVQLVLDQDAKDIQMLGVNRTPTFYVNGKKLAEFGVQQLYDLVGQELASYFEKE